MLGTISTLVREKDGIVMVYVASGTFQMGSTQGDDNEKPVHPVTLDGFWMDRTEVTNAQYALCVAAGRCTAPFPLSTLWAPDGYYGSSQYADYPVLNVSWHEAMTYCTWAGGQLPTEAQWEYAARGVDGRTYPWGNSEPDCAKANYANCKNSTTRVGSYPLGASPFGVLDMAGNLWEYVADWYGNYPAEPQVNPIGPASGTLWVLRGGSWNNGPEFARATNRETVMDRRTHIFGFRCVVESGS